MYYFARILVNTISKENKIKNLHHVNCLSFPVR